MNVLLKQLKIEVGQAFAGARDEKIEIRGRDLITGLPKTIEVKSDEVSEALTEPVTAIVQCVKRVLEDTPPELSSDIMDRGIIMTGGGAMLYGLDSLIQKETGITTYLADDPLTCVAIGTGKALEYMDKITRISKKANGRRIEE